jgi:hypothetical protein
MSSTVPNSTQAVTTFLTGRVTPRPVEAAVGVPAPAVRGTTRDTVSLDEAGRKILGFLTARGPMKTAELVGQLGDEGISLTSVARAVNQLTAMGVVEVTARDVVAIVGDERSAG